MVSLLHVMLRLSSRVCTYSWSLCAFRADRLSCVLGTGRQDIGNRQGANNVLQAQR